MTGASLAPSSVPTPLVSSVLRRRQTLLPLKTSASLECLFSPPPCASFLPQRQDPSPLAASAAIVSPKSLSAHGLLDVRTLVEGTTGGRCIAGAPAPYITGPVEAAATGVASRDGVGVTTTEGSASLAGFRLVLAAWDVIDVDIVSSSSPHVPAPGRPACPTGELSTPGTYENILAIVVVGHGL